MEPVWYKNYPKGVPHTIDPDAYHSIMDVFNRSILKFREKNAYMSMGQTITFDDLDRLSSDFAAYLQVRYGVQKGDRVAIMMPNLIQYPIVLFGAFKAGCTVVNVNPLYKPRELAHQLKDSGAETIVILANFAHVLADVIEDSPVRNVVVTQIGDCLGGFKRILVNSVVKYVKKMVPRFQLDGAHHWPSVMSEGSTLNHTHVPLSHDDIAFLQYTGGTTGVSKGVVLTHRNMLANMQQAHAWVDLREGQELVVTALPLYHIFSLTANCLVFLYLGGCNLLIANPRDIPQFIKTLSKVTFTAITGVNTLFNALMGHPDFTQLDFTHLRLTLGGGMAVQKVVADQWKELTHCPLLEAYGLTEASPAVTVNPLNLDDYNGSIGLPIPSTDICIRDEDGKDCGIGDVGELCVKGPQVMSGYWNRPDETALIMTEDGWLKTGDMAYVDDQGYVFIVSRKKDMILVSGFNVYPNEIEDVLMEHAGIREVAAIGIEDDASGERVKCCIVKEDDALTESDVIEFARQNLTDYKIPKEIEFFDELPKTNVGKILHRALRD